MTVELRDLRLVEAIAEHGNLTRAGTVLYLTQSALSRQLTDLERRLGATLFMRNGKRMVLTPAGERLREAAQEVLGLVSRAVEEVRDVASEVEALVRVSTECYTCYHWLPGLLREFRHQFPRVETRVVASMTRRPVQALLKGQLDVAIVSDPVRDRRIEVTPLFEDELMVVVSPDHPWAEREWVEARDFADQHLLVYNVPRSDLTVFREVLIPASVLPRQVSKIELTEAIIELVRADLGVGVLAGWAVAPHRRAGALRTLRLTERGFRRQWSAATVRRKATPVHLRAFVDLLAKTVQPEPESGPGWCAA